jgi:hypothetical protein
VSSNPPKGINHFPFFLQKLLDMPHITLNCLARLSPFRKNVTSKLTNLELNVASCLHIVYIPFIYIFLPMQKCYHLLARAHTDLNLCIK